MQAQKIQSVSLISPYSYFKAALKLIRINEIDEALKSIDSAILFSQHTPFYIYQKVKLLFSIQHHEQCLHTINSHISYLYKHGSLYIVCRILDYYQKLTQCNQVDLCTFLINYQLPSCLALHYTSWLTTRRRNILSHAQNAFTHDQWNSCIDYCNLYLKGYAPTYDILYLKALAYYRLGNLYKSKELLNCCLSMNSKEPSIYLHLGYIHMELYKFNEAIDAFQSASSLDPENKNYMLHIGECYTASREYDLAYHFYKKLSIRYPQDQQIRFNLFYLCSKHSKKICASFYMRKLKKEMHL